MSELINVGKSEVAIRRRHQEPPDFSPQQIGAIRATVCGTYIRDGYRLLYKDSVLGHTMVLTEGPSPLG